MMDVISEPVSRMLETPRVDIVKTPRIVLDTIDPVDNEVDDTMLDEEDDYDDDYKDEDDPS